MNEIRKNLWLGSVKARDKQLQENGIQVVVSVMTEFERMLFCEELDENVMEYRVELDDSPMCSLMEISKNFNRILEGELEKGNKCLVHCVVGRSRSASLVIAYLMYKEGISAAHALEEVKKERPSIAPNQGFLEQLNRMECEK